MNSVILKTATNFLLPLLLLFSVFILLRGHNLPGGGFVGGLVASIAFVIYAFANGFRSARSLFRIHPGFLIPTGLLLSFSTSFLPLLLGKPFLFSLWAEKDIPVLGRLNSTLFFDLGVYIVVIGVTITILFNIAEANVEKK